MRVEVEEMPEIIIKSADTAQKNKKTILILEGNLRCTSLLEEYLDTPSLVAFSQACKTAQRMSYDALLKSLLSAVVCGDEKLAKKIVTVHPKLLLDASARVKDYSGKEIKDLTPLQAAICAGDVDMVQMIFDVLQHKLEDGITLSFEPKHEIQRQFSKIYPEGIDAVEAYQKVEAQAFKASTLNQIFAAINAATENQVKFELDTPGQAIIATEEELRFEQENPGVVSEHRRLNVALHNFRAQVAALSNLETIFNPFNLLAAFDLYNEQYDNLSGNDDEQENKRDLLWWQVVGYIQRHLPACYLQAFARGICAIAEEGAKLERTFVFHFSRKDSMKPESGDLNNLGYKWAAAPLWAPMYRWHIMFAVPAREFFVKFIADKKIRLGKLTQPVLQWHQLQYYLPIRCAIT